MKGGDTGMADAKITADGTDDALPAIIRKRGGPRKRPAVTPAPRDDDKPVGWAAVFGILLDLDRRGEMGRVIERWPVTSLTELRDAIDAAIENVTEAGGTDIGVGPAEVVLAHYPRSEGKPYRVSIKTPVRPVADA